VWQRGIVVLARWTFPRPNRAPAQSAAVNSAGSRLYVGNHGLRAGPERRGFADRDGHQNGGRIARSAAPGPPLIARSSRQEVCSSRWDNAGTPGGSKAGGAVYPDLRRLAVAFLIASAITGCSGTSNDLAATDRNVAHRLAAEDPSSPPQRLVGTTASIPDDWVTRSFCAISVAAPPTWEPVVLRDNEVTTAAELDPVSRKDYLESLKMPDMLGALLDTQTLGASILEYFVTDITVSAQSSGEPPVDAEELVALARDNYYSGPDAPKDAELSAFAHPVAPAIQARYPFDQDGQPGIAIEYAIAFPDWLVFLDLATDNRNPDADIATAEQIGRSARIN
jgi:hypothetical protein